jgi:uncharacterized membrane protein
MDEYTDISGTSKPTKVGKVGTWAGMNNIQRIGVIGLFPFMILSFIYSGRLGIIFGLMGWTSIFIGYVAGNLWRFRHALHFWLSMTAACIVHIALLPVYASLIDKMKHAHGQDGKTYMYLSFLILIVEVLALQYALKNVGMWLRARTHKPNELERVK